MVVGNAPSPNLKNVRSKIGSMNNSNYKPGGGNVKIESKKLTFDAKSKVGAINEQYKPGGGDKKVNIITHIRELAAMEVGSECSEIKQC